MPKVFPLLPATTLVYLIPVLFVLAALFYFISCKDQWLGSGIPWILLALQACTVFGLFALLEPASSSQRQSGLILTSLVTLLTTAAIYLSSRIPSSSQPESQATPLNEVPIGRALTEQLESLSRQLFAEKYRNTQLILLNELSQQLEAELDPPVSAQLAVNTLERAMDCSVVVLFTRDPDTQEFVVLASAGKMTGLIPPGYRQEGNSGLLGRTARGRKTIIVKDTRREDDFIRLENDNTLSIVSVPLIHQGHVKGILEIGSDKTETFGSADAALAEGVACELVRSWERSNYLLHITELIQAGISPQTLMMGPQASVQEVAFIARKTLEAQFVFVMLLDQQGNFSRTAIAGEATRLLAALNANMLNEPLIQAALNATTPFRIRDVRKYSTEKKLDIDRAGLRSALVIPIRLYRFSIGAILAFGKQEDIYFSEKDESLADLLSSQAAAALEGSWLYQDSRSKDSINKLSVDIIRTEDLGSAAESIALAAHRMTGARQTGVILMTKKGQLQAQVQVDEQGMHADSKHPMELIEQTIQSGEHIMMYGESDSFACYPLLTHQRTYGAIWMNLPESVQNLANIEPLVKQAAMALERSLLLSETRQQAQDLETAYDLTLKALTSALDARDRETEGHSTRVSRLSCRLGQELGLSGPQLKALERGSLLHDLGKIGISDTILHKPGKLTEEEWRIMRMHPDIGARIVENIPFLLDTLPVIQYHHERWDGSGYPRGLKETDIPLHARIFAVADVFDALTSKRAYREKSSAQEAMAYLEEQAGILFDPDIVDALTRIPYAQFIQGKIIPV